MKLILFNGPPRCGKDTLGKGLIQHLLINRYAFHEKFSAPLKTAFAGMMSLSVYKDFVVQTWEDRKEEIVPGLGVSFRRWQQDMSEKFMKPLYGIDIFARLLHQRLIDNCGHDTLDLPATCVITDCGFGIECEYLIDRWPKKDTLLFRIARAGTSFEGDTREWVYPDDEGTETIDFHNNRPIEESQSLINDTVDRWLKNP